MLRIFSVCAVLAATPVAAQLQLNVVQESLDLRPEVILRAEAVQQIGQWAVAIRLGPGAASMFGAVTTRGVGKKMQIVVGDRILSTPIVQNPILPGEVWSTGNLTESEARALAASLRR